MTATDETYVFKVYKHIGDHGKLNFMELSLSAVMKMFPNVRNHMDALVVLNENVETLFA